MPQHNRQTETSGPPTVEDVEQWLFGLGQFTLQLDGCRLTAPSPLCRRLGPLRQQPFVFSIWHGPRLRIIPQAFWTPYLNCLRAEIPDPVTAGKLVSCLRQECKVGALDHRHRWDLPVAQAQLVGLVSAQNSVVLLPYRFWLELLSRKAWEERMTQTLHYARDAALLQVDFEI